MAFIYATQNFEAIAHEKPFVSREEGGHIKIFSKNGVEDRTKLTRQEAMDFMRITMLIGEALEIAMNNRGVPVVKVNYEDLGNWAFKKGKKPRLHIHLFGRSKDAVKQPFPEAVYLPPRESGFYDGFVALNEDDIKEIQKQISILENTEKYSFEAWGLTSKLN